MSEFESALVALYSLSVTHRCVVALCVPQNVLVFDICVKWQVLCVTRVALFVCKCEITSFGINKIVFQNKLPQNVATRARIK
uniref:Putative secreted protein n=1 Tax=Xenopsylla cheopis TaxID=163159 RepID=A0A6M2E2H3_XENCH